MGLILTTGDFIFSLLTVSVSDMRSLRQLMRDCSEEETSS